MVGLRLVQELRLSQQLVMTPQLQLAIKLLQLNRLELVDRVRQEMTENPVLEESLDAPSEPDDGGAARRERDGADGDAARSAEPGTQKLESTDQGESGKEVDWDRYLENHANQPPMPSFRRNTEDLPNIEATLAGTSSLFEHLLWQIKMASFVENERHFALLVAGNLDGRGYLVADVSLEELSDEAGLNTEDAEEVLKMVQELDPIGVGARDLRECLMAQVRVLELDEDVEAIADRHLHNLERHNYQAIARDLQIPLKDVYDAAKIISGLEPRPGRNHSGDDSRYITPDVFVHKLGDEYFVVPNDDGMPNLKISGYYRSALSANKETKDYIKSKLRSAQWLIRSIDQRRRTIIKVTECIVEKQREFFDKGIDYLKPMILRDVAEAVGMHESTISRVSNSKFVHTPQGIFELKYFFNPGISRRGASDTSSESVKNAIKVLIGEENKWKPLSDQKIVALLRERDIVIARRTVAKYREVSGILSSSKRRRVF